MSFFSGDRERYKLYRYKVLQLSRISEKNWKFLFFFLQQRKAGERKEIYTERVGDGQKGGAGRGGIMNILLTSSRPLPAPFTLTLDHRRPVE